MTGAVAVAILAPAAGADGTAVATADRRGVLATVMTVYLCARTRARSSRA